MMKDSMRSKLLGLCRRLEEIDAMLASPEATNDMNRFRDLSCERAEIEPLTVKMKEYEKTEADIAAAKELAQDPDMRELAQEEIDFGEEKLQALEKALELMLLPSDPNDKRNIYLEIRAGTGGDESALFAGDLLRMYMRYAERQGWKVEIASKNQSDLGGYKEVICRIIGEGAYSKLKFESGGHRVQRVPETEAAGRIHTSACTVAVLPELDEVEAVKINPADLRIDVYRAGGPGGQCVNTTDSAVRVTHFPSGIVVTCQNERSQIQNKAACMQILKARLYEIELEKRAEALDEIRGPKTTIGFGNQIRSYVLYPYQMVKDLRTGVETSNVEAVLDDGDLDPFVIGYHRWATGNADAEGSDA